MVQSGREEHRRFGVSLGISTGVGAEPRLPRSLFCREGRRLPTTSTVISACGGKKGRERERERGRERERERVLVSPAQAQGVASPGGAQSIRRPGEWCEVWCLLCHGKTAAYEGRGAGPRNACGDLRGLLFPPSFQRSHVCRHTNTDVRHHKLNKMNGYMLQF